MKAVSCTGGKLAVVEQPTPIPGRGQLLIDVLSCGICGSDLHARHSCDELADVASEIGYAGMMRFDQEVVFGHEFCGEIIEHGPGSGSFHRPEPGW
jgi:threonine dehydrogenase-like Zn-dependent dehydrogenase